MSITIRTANSSDILDIAEVLTQAAHFKSEQGDYLWGDQPFTHEEVGERMKKGGLYAVVENDAIVGTVYLTDSDERVWGDNGEGNVALYVHGLAISDMARGRGIGGQVLEWAVGIARDQRKKALRLDCSYTNTRLCSYYLGRGFTEVGRRDISRRSNARDVRDSVYRVALLQRDITR